MSEQQFTVCGIR